MENLSREELVSILGEEAANEIIAQREAGNSSGGKVPFTFLNKISDMLGNDLGAFGEFVVGVEKSKDDKGNTVYNNKGINLGKNFEFVIVSSCFYYKRFVPGSGNTQGRVFSSNLMRDLSELEKAVDNNGNPLPKTKDEKKALGWKVVRMNAGLVRKTAKDAWVPCIWEVDGSMLFGFNNVIEGVKDRGILSGVLNITTGIEKKGQIPYVVIDGTSTFKPLPAKFFTDEGTKLSDIILKMKEFIGARQGATTQAAPEAPQATTTETVPEGW